jgi:hypothetical protein
MTESEAHAPLGDHLERHHLAGTGT